ncbi:MAG: TIGR01777 family oxidoreductase [Desulfosarcinaceae bacterium]
MKIVISGGTGFVGSHLCRHFLDQGHEVCALGSRSEFNLFAGQDNFTYQQADTTRPGPWQDALKSAELIVNLAGRTIFHRWTAAYKQQLLDSRILTTRNIVAALGPGQKSTQKPILISASAVGYYGDRGDDELSENEPAGDDFLARLAVQWEEEALKAAAGARVIRVRLGIVLGRGGGALASMLPAFKSYMGGVLGSGRQWFPWIHMDDAVAALDFLLAHGRNREVFNLCSPDPVQNKTLTRTLGRIVGKPTVMSVPSFMLKMAAGELASVLLASTRALPANLLASGFKFRYSDLEKALKNLI